VHTCLQESGVRTCCACNCACSRRTRSSYLHCCAIFESGVSVKHACVHHCFCVAFVMTASHERPGATPRGTQEPHRSRHIKDSVFVTACSMCLHLLAWNQMTCITCLASALALWGCRAHLCRRCQRLSRSSQHTPSASSCPCSHEAATLEAAREQR
jgi:hypothetical protein